MAFHKKPGLRILDMVKSNWVYRKLRNFRAGIESDTVSEARLCLARCVWRGLDHFAAYVWSSVVAYNLALFARLKPTSLSLSASHSNPGRSSHRSPSRTLEIIEAE